MTKSYSEINKRIENGGVIVVTAEEMIKIVEDSGIKVAAKEIDVVTTGTFGPMCSSGAFLNFGHSDPPIKFEHLWLNDVHAYHGNAAVDCYIGVTRMAEKRPFEYGGGNVIEDLVSGKPIRLKGTSNTTDCYPLGEIDTTISLNDLNQAILCNPRNASQRYFCATNSTEKTLYTYMGKLLPNFGNAHFSGSGSLNPLCNDPEYETIGIGTRIFLGGGIGYVIGEGTQHDPLNRLGTLFVKGDLKQMYSEYLKGVNYEHYGTSMFVGVGIPIPILNKELAKKTAIKDEEILTEVVDYGIPRRERPILTVTNYKELKSGKIKVNGKIIFVKDLKKKAIICYSDCDIKLVAKKIIDNNANHIVITDRHLLLEGIVTSFDITKAMAEEKSDLKEIITRKVISTYDDEPLDIAARKMRTNNISALPVLDNGNKVIGIITAEELV
ncbi:MAG: homocysteine biosynthesis protein [Candidatus Lokiarchaeota archaeon]